VVSANVSNHYTTRRHNPQDRNLSCYCRENLDSCNSSFSGKGESTSVQEMRQFGVFCVLQERHSSDLLVRPSDAIQNEGATYSNNTTK